MYFASKRGAWSGMWEYFVDSDTDTNDASEISAHVPKYLNGEVINIQASSNEDMLLIQTDNDPQALYVYRYYWQGRENYRPLGHAGYLVVMLLASLSTEQTSSY